VVDGSLERRMADLEAREEARERAREAREQAREAREKAQEDRTVDLERRIRRSEERLHVLELILGVVSPQVDPSASDFERCQDMEDRISVLFYNY
jgi:hypothetical protein